MVKHAGAAPAPDDPRVAAAAGAWTLDPAVRYLNHGSFGAVPAAVQAEQARLRAAMERNPVAFLDRELPARLDGARERLAAFVGARPENLVFVANATAGVATVLRSIPFAAGDEVLLTDHGYPAVRNAAEAIALAAGARVVTVRLALPVAGPGAVVDAVAAAVGPHTRLAIVDHVTSPTALVLPVAAIASALAGSGVDVLVDGAHAPAMLDLDLEALGAAGVAWYTGNAHKWVASPRSAALLWARPDRQAMLRPLAPSHGWAVRRPGRAVVHDLFDWTGTHDPTPYLCIPTALDTLAGLVEGGWPALRGRNHALAVAAREQLLAALGVAAPAPPSMLGSMASVPLPPGDAPALAAALRAAGFEVPVFAWPRPPGRMLRVSAQLYNTAPEYGALAAALRAALAG